MDDQQPTATDSELSRTLGAAHAYIQTLPGLERRIASLAANGSPIWEIAQETGSSEGFVSRTLNDVLAAVSGRRVTEVETGGLGSDTDPGIHGGYGDTGFGALDTEPLPDNSEPDERP